MVPLKRQGQVVSDLNLINFYDFSLHPENIPILVDPSLPCGRFLFQFEENLLEGIPTVLVGLTPEGTGGKSIN